MRHYIFKFITYSDLNIDCTVMAFALIVSIVLNMFNIIVSPDFIGKMQQLFELWNFSALKVLMMMPSS